MNKEWTKKMERAAQDYQIALNQWEERKDRLQEPYLTYHREALEKADAKCKAMGLF